jgi:flagellar P-ring protein precursor FlgI
MAMRRAASGERRAANRLLRQALMAVVACASLSTLDARRSTLHAQELRVSDLTVEEKGVPVRLVGYGIVAGLDGTGDRGIGGRSGGMTVQSVANLLRRFNVEIPPEVLRTRNVAAVLVTAELNPYLRPGGRFEVQVSSLGDARSLRGGVLWITPLVADPNGPAVATAQGGLLVSDAEHGGYRVVNAAVNSGRVPAGGVLETDLPRPAFAAVSRLVLRDPDLGTASRLAQAINAAVGQGTAKIEDPGSVQLDLKGSPDEKAATLSRIRDLRIRPDRRATLVLDARRGTVVTGGDVPLGDASVSHNGLTVTIGAVVLPARDSVAPADSALRSPPSAVGAEQTADSGRRTAPSERSAPLRIPPGTQASELAAALHAVKASAADVAAIFTALRDAGAIAAEIVVR